MLLDTDITHAAVSSRLARKHFSKNCSGRTVLRRITGFNLARVIAGVMMKGSRGRLVVTRSRIEGRVRDLRRAARMRLSRMRTRFRRSGFGAPEDCSRVGCTSPSNLATRNLSARCVTSSGSTLIHVDLPARAVVLVDSKSQIEGTDLCAGHQQPTSRVSNRGIGMRPERHFPRPGYPDLSSS
jgi:hypothetical protein